MLNFPFTAWFVAAGLSPLLLLTIGPIFLEIGTVLWATARRIRDDTVLVTVYASRFARAVGILLVILGMVMFASGYDASGNNPYLTYNDLAGGRFGGGGPAFVHCTDYFFIPSYTPGNSGVCGFQTVNCANGYNQSGTDSCTITIVACTASNTFSPAFPTTPSHFGVQYTGGIPLYTASQSVTMFTQAVVFNVESLDTSALASDVLKTTSPMSFTLAVTPATTNEMAVVSTFISNNSTSPSGPVTVSDTQNTVWTQSVPVTFDAGFAFSAESVFTGKLPTTAADTITVQWTDTAVVKDYIGGTVELIKNVDHVGAISTLAFLGGTSQSVTLTPQLPNEFLVGNAYNEFSLQTPPFVCDPVTLSAPATTRQTDANCSANKRISFAAGDQNPSTVALQTFTATYPDASTVDEGVINVLELVPTLSQGTYWSVGPALGELFGNSYNELVYSVPAGIGQASVTMHYTCVQSTNSSATVNLYLYAGTTQSSVANPTCDGTERSGGILNFNGFTASQTMKIQAQVSPSGHTKLMFSMLYFTVTYTVNQGPTIRENVIPTATSVTWQCFFAVRVTTSVVCSWNWYVAYP